MVSVLVKYGNVDTALRALKKRAQQECNKFTKKRFFESKGQKRRMKLKQSLLRRRKIERRDLF